MASTCPTTSMIKTGSLLLSLVAIVNSLELTRSLSDINVACNGSAHSDASVHATCEDFCNSRCSFVANSELPTRVHSLTLYRETPINVTELSEKDAGDAAGDMGFYLSNHNLAYICKQTPNATACQQSNAIEKDSQNNIFIEFTVEVDGNFGPYQMCNPYYGWDTTRWECFTYCETPPMCGAWVDQQDSLGWMGPTCFCENGLSNRTVGRHNQTDMGHKPAKDWPKQCVTNDFFDISAVGYCSNGTILKNISAATATEGECCSACAATKGCEGWSMYDGINGSCSLLSGHDWYHVQPSNPCVSAYNFDSDLGHISDGALGGFWYSLPKDGECVGHQQPGDGSGCTWRLVSTTKYVNSTCVSAVVDGAIETFGKSCFDKCTAPTDKTTACYTKCFAQTVNGNTTASVARMPIDEILNAFSKAFISEDPSNGGCKNLKPTDHSQFVEIQMRK